MDQFRNLWNFSQRDKNSFILSELSLGAVVLVLLLLLQLPGMYVSGKIEDAEVAVYQTAPETLDIAETRLIAEASWFDPSYSEGLPEKIIAGRQLLNEDNVSGAELLLEEAKSGNLDDARELAQEAIVLANQAVGLADEVMAQLDQNIADRDAAFARYEALKAADAAMILHLNESDRRFTAEEDRYLLKYSSEIEQKLESAASLHITANQHIIFADRALPGLDNVEWSGDPLLAVEEIEQALVTINEINTLTAYVTSRLDLLAEAEANAQSRVNNADNQIKSVSDYLFSLELSRGYDPARALKDAYFNLTEAENHFEAATVTLATIHPTEGKIDYLLAYETAQSSLNSSATANRVANEVVAADDQSSAKLASFESSRDTAQSSISSAESARDTLDRYHANSTWSSVVNNISDSRSKLTMAQAYRTAAQTARANQEFILANQKAQSALDELSGINTLCNAVVTMKNSLENLRLQTWPSAKSDAESAISSARSVINSSHTDASLSSANRYLSDAESDARGGYYASAISNAESAESAANSAKSEARSDEQAYQRKLEQDAEATRKAERDAEATRNAPPPPVFDSGSSGSSNGSGGSIDTGNSGSSGSGDNGSMNPGGGDNCAFGCD